MGNPENAIFNLVLKLTFPLVQYFCVQKLCNIGFIFIFIPHSKSCLLY